MIRIPEHHKFFCNTCESDATQMSLGSGRINVKPTDRETTYQTHEVFKCRECSDITLMISNWIHPGSMMGDPYKTKINYHPPRSFRTKPYWYKKLNKKFRSVLDEVYTALDNSLFLIASTGTRTAIDKLILDKIGDVGSFEKKINTLEKKNIINTEEKKLLLAVIDAGSASAHRGFKPTKKLISHIMEITESIFYKICIEPKKNNELLKKANKIKSETPKR